VKRFGVLVSTGVIALALLSGCTAAHRETAKTALNAFCILHRAEIFHTLLTAEQIRAGYIVCGAVGMGLGS